MSRFEKFLQKQNGRDWRDSAVLKVDLDRKESGGVLKTYKIIEEGLSQVKNPNTIVVGGWQDISRLVKGLADSKYAFTQSVKKIFICHMQVNPQSIVKDFIGAYKNLEELSISELNDVQWLTDASKLDNLRIIKIQKVKKQVGQLGKKLIKIPNLQQLHIQIESQPNKGAAAFVEDISSSSTITRLSFVLYNPENSEHQKDEVQQEFSASGAYLAQMPNLKTFCFCVRNCFTYLPEFLNKALESKSIETISINIQQVTTQALALCLKPISTTQAKTLFFKSNFIDYKTVLSLHTYDDLGDCPNLHVLYLNLRHQNSGKNSIKSQLYKLCKRLVFADFMYY